MGKKKQVEFITREEFDASLEELNVLNTTMDAIDWRTQREKYDEAEQAYQDRRDLLQNRIDELANHDVIAMISEATEHGIDPSNALGEWITSWC